MTDGGDRRRWVRQTPREDGPLAAVRLRMGPTLRVGDLSSAGARVLGSTRLLPGLHVDIHVISASGRQLVRCRVVWARVAELAPLQYVAGLLFDAPLELLDDGYLVPGMPDAAPGLRDRGYPGPQVREPARGDFRPVLRTIGPGPAIEKSVERSV